MNLAISFISNYYSRDLEAVRDPVAIGGAAMADRDAALRDLAAGNIVGRCILKHDWDEAGAKM